MPPRFRGNLNLLRCAIVLAGAGMDAVLRRLATDALPVMLASPIKHPDTAKKFKQHVSEQVKEKGAPKSWIEAILADDPRPEMVRLYVEALTKGSLQNETDLKRLRDALGVREAVVSDETVAGLKGFLIARNQVAHDLDLKRPDDETRGNRYTRTVRTVLEQCDQLIQLNTAFVIEVSDLLKRKKAPPTPARSELSKASS